MQKAEAKKLLATIRELAKRDVVIEAYLALIEVEVRADVHDFKEVTPEYVDDTIIANRLLLLAELLITFQTNRCRNYEEELKELRTQ